MKEQILAIVLDPIFIGIVLSWAGYLVKKFIEKKASVKAETIYACAMKGFALAEKQIPDNVENKSLKKIDEALKVFTSEMENNGLSVSQKAIADAKKLFTLFSAKQKGIV